MLDSNDKQNQGQDDKPAVAEFQAQPGWSRSEISVAVRAVVAGGAHHGAAVLQVSRHAGWRCAEGGLSQIPAVHRGRHYKRNGTTTLFAALYTLQGKVIGQCYQRHRNQEFLKFLRILDKEFLGKVPLHLIMGNYGTHKHENVRNWLKRHPRFVLHFVPTSSSWLNLVERWFAELDEKAIRRGVFLSVDDLKTAIEAFLASWNKGPKPFVWTATVDSIKEKLSRCRQTLEKIQPGCTLPKTRRKKQ